MITRFTTALVWLVLTAGAFAQTQTHRVAIPSRTISGNAPLPASEEAGLLAENYRLVFSAKNGDKQVGELSTLSCSPRVAVTGMFQPEQIPAIISVSGTVAEKEGVITFAYSISFRIPTPTQVMHGGKSDQGFVSTVAYQEQECTGALRMKPGKSYDVLKAGGVTYSVTISPESDK